jgi:hypothetical protein
MDQASDLPAHVKKLMATLAALPVQERCSKCGSKLLHIETALFSAGSNGKVRTLPMPVCPKCDLNGNIARFIPPPPDVC